MKKRRKRLTDWQGAYGINARKIYNEYRNGKPRKLPLAPIFKEKDRVSIVDSVMDVLNDWRLSPFENEGPVRAGVRASLCMKGYAWGSSDLEAGLIVSGGLKRMGAERPSWDQGQREYTIPAENCAWCGGERDPAVGGRFCTVECAKAFVMDRQARETGRDTAIYKAAVRVLRRDRMDRRKCLNCQKPFMHDGPKDPRQYCSKACFNEYRRTDAFKKFPSVCRYCDKPFMGRKSGAWYCSRTCQTDESRIRTGSPNMPKRISPRVFDYVITKPTNAYFSTRLTPQRFDWIAINQGLRVTMERAA